MRAFTWVQRGLRDAYTLLRLHLSLGALGLACLAYSLVVFPLRFVLKVEHTRGWGRRNIHRIFRAYLWFLSALGGARFDVRALDALQGEPGLIIVPNHPTMLDAPMVLARLTNVVCVMKADLVGNVFVGTGAMLAGYIPNEPVVNLTRHAVAELRAGSQLLLFPEGTRTVRLPTNPMLRTVGVIARQARAPVQTVLIEASSGFLGKGWPMFRPPASEDVPLLFRLRLGRRFDPPDDAEAFTRELEAYFAEALQGAMLPQLPVTRQTR